MDPNVGVDEECRTWVMGEMHERAPGQYKGQRAVSAVYELKRLAIHKKIASW